MAKKIPVALELFSVREDCTRDLPGVLAAVRKMGYEGVEFAGTYDRTAKELRKLLDDNGLPCCGTHTGLATLLGDALKATIEFHQVLGNKFLIVPGVGKEHTSSRQAWLKTAGMFNELAEKARPHGMLVGYHNHSTEFRPLDGELPWDTFFGNTRPEVVMQMDTGNCIAGGGDPAAFLRKYPGRALTVHLKEFSRTGAAFGQGDMQWKDTFDACEQVGGTQWYIVEYEEPGHVPMESVKFCIDVLRKMGK
jgi:sugar phosphate isomerase/epimerase